MGQYYKLVCAETSTFIDPYPLGAGLKAVEQINSRGPSAALAFLCATGTGDHPRDLPWAPKGAWAGRTPLMIGDYAANDDIRGRASVLSMPENEYYDKIYAGKGDARLDQGRRKSKTPKGFSDAFLPVYERVAGTRATDLDATGEKTDGARSWRDFMDVVPDPKFGWDVSFEGYSESEKREHIDYLERTGAMKNPLWRRGPIPMSAHGLDLPQAPDIVPGPELGHGTALLWVNLDREEFIDPAEVGDVPDLAGIMNGTSAKAVQAMILHAVRRGGGDLADHGPLCQLGRWRGDRIALIGSDFKLGPRNILTQGQVRQTFLNVSGNAALVCQDELIFGVEDAIYRDTSAEGDTEPKADLDAIGTRLIGAAMKDPYILEITRDVETARSLRFTIVPPLKISTTGAGKKLPKPVTIAPRFDVAVYDQQFGSQKVCLSQATHRAIGKIFSDFEMASAEIKIDKTHSLLLDYGLATEFTCKGLSQHDIMAFLGKLETAQA
jgi:hypothetical protein